MFSPRRPLTALFAVAACAAALAAASVAFAAPTVSLRDAGTAAPITGSAASVKVRVCQEAPYYDNRLITYRASMSRLPAAGDVQKLLMRFNVIFHDLQTNKNTKLKASGLGKWARAGSTATAYQRDLTLTDLETYGYYKLQANFRWLDGTGKIQARKTLATRWCKQRLATPALKITAVKSVPVPGSTDLIHTVTVRSDSMSEAINVPVAINVDGKFVSTAMINSIGPQQSLDVQVRAPACQASAFAQIDPQHTRPRYAMEGPIQAPIVPCK